PRFEASVRSLLGLMKKSRLTRPFDLLATSMNYYQAFIPSNHHGISVLCEVYPEQKFDGAIKLDGRGVADLYCVPDPEDPARGARWKLANVIFRLGLPVPGQGLERTVRQTRDYWDSILDDIPHARISDNTVRAWQKLARRTFLEESDSVFGLAYGEYPAVFRESDDRTIGFHPRRMARRRLDPILSRLIDATGNSLASLWIERPDGTRPNSYPLIFIFSSLKWDRGVNFGRGYISMNVEDRDAIPARPVPGKPTWDIDLTGNITEKISHTRLVRGCHEVAHSFGLGDEYSEKGTMPQTADVDTHYGNLQKHSDLLHPVSNAVDGDQIKWRWHRIRKAAVIAAPITEVEPGKFRIPVVLGQATQFAIGNTVLLRVRRYPNPLPRNPPVSDHLQVIGVADPGGTLDPARPRAPDNPLIGAVFVSVKEGHAFSAADAGRFTPGCIVYLPVVAPDSVRADDYPFAELVAKNIRDHITDRERALNQDPDSDEICVADENDIQKPVKLSVDLPFCFKHKNRIVGLFTGGKTFHCGVYHPTGSFIMRNSNSNGKEFCAVCRYLLVDIIDPNKHFSLDLEYQEIYPQK
ncbi:MAG TPA: M64 family metallopeptidase, partial [Candidatus Binatia bacterium]|nr:M64 family metallopeptidase [Candidatus Binatia bacterium]